MYILHTWFIRDIKVAHAHNWGRTYNLSSHATRALRTSYGLLQSHTSVIHPIWLTLHAIHSRVTSSILYSYLS